MLLVVGIVKAVIVVATGDGYVIVADVLDVVGGIVVSGIILDAVAVCEVSCDVNYVSVGVVAVVACCICVAGC